LPLLLISFFFRATRPSPDLFEVAIKCKSPRIYFFSFLRSPPFLLYSVFLALPFPSDSSFFLLLLILRISSFPFSFSFPFFYHRLGFFSSDHWVGCVQFDTFCSILPSPLNDLVSWATRAVFRQNPVPQFRYHHLFPGGGSLFCL